MVKLGNWNPTENCFLTTYHPSFTGAEFCPLIVFCLVGHDSSWHCSSRPVIKGTSKKLTVLTYLHCVVLESQLLENFLQWQTRKLGREDTHKSENIHQKHTYVCMCHLQQVYWLCSTEALWKHLLSGFRRPRIKSWLNG
jgi:hypothetical protein